MAEEMHAIEKYRTCYAFPALGAVSIEMGLFRLRGIGLSNLLMTWARCLVQARRYGLQRISPTWFQVCPGPWMRNERDKRTYHDLFQNAPDEVTGLTRLILLASRQRTPESQLGEQIAHGSIVVFHGIEGLLQPVLSERRLVVTELLKIIRSQHKKALHTGFRPDVAIHIRLGDFGLQNPCANNNRIGLDWYVRILSNLRASFGNLNAAVFSDGSDQELAPLLQMDGVQRVTFGSSIADVLGLSQGRIQITSGSTFSMWASFIGQRPAIWYPERLPHPLLEDRRCEISTIADLPREFLAHCERSLGVTTNSEGTESHDKHHLNRHPAPSCIEEP